MVRLFEMARDGAWPARPFMDSAMMARLQKVAPFLVAAMAKSADIFMAFFLSNKSMFVLEEVMACRPTSHFLRNFCLSLLGLGILLKKER